MHKALALAGFAASLIAAVPAHAGYKQTNGVYINTAGRFATGSLADVRNDGTPNSLIEITIEGSNTYFAANVYFRNGATFAGCSTSNAAMVQTLASAPSDAQVTAYWDANGQCTSVTVANTSFNAPKTP